MLDVTYVNNVLLRRTHVNDHLVRVIPTQINTGVYCQAYMLCHTLGRHAAATNLCHIDDVLHLHVHVHVHVCAELGCVWTWGYGQACGKKRCDVLTPEKRFLRHSNAVQVAGGQSHSVALTGALFERRVNKRLSYLHERSVHRYAQLSYPPMPGIGVTCFHV